jgi:NAD(P)-dependent dehydrogenase (short-subunit alcohol dehydrogenase family)
MSFVAVALVTGANRGIGFEVARELGRDGMRVLLGSRDGAKCEAAAAELAGEGLDITPLELDVAVPRAAAAVVPAAIEAAGGALDVLVNNAGIYPGGRASRIDFDVVEATWEANAAGAWRVAVAALPYMAAAARIVNVSSEAGSLASMDASMPAYNVSKAALNAITRVLAADLRSSGILVNSVCPGWVRTDMGGSSASRSVEAGAASVLWAARLGPDGPTGGFFRDGRPVPW